MAYFSPSCFTSTKDASDAGFFAVYRTLFATLETEEEEAIQRDSDANVEAYRDPATGIAAYSHNGLPPSFGDASTPYDPFLRRFYDRYTNFTSVKSFRWWDQYRLSDIPDRRLRRLAEKHNRRRRETARREFTETVRNLAAYVRRRDPRYKAFVAAAEADKAAAEARRVEMVRAARAERLKLAEAFKEAEWSKTRHDDDDAVAEDDADLYYDEYQCVACNKAFKSDRQLANHEKSKKHIDAVRRLREELLADGLDLGSDNDNDGGRDTDSLASLADENVDTGLSDSAALDALDVPESDAADAHLEADVDVDVDVELDLNAESGPDLPTASKASKHAKKNRRKKQTQLGGIDDDGGADESAATRLDPEADPLLESLASLKVDKNSGGPGGVGLGAPANAPDSDDDEDIWNTKRGGGKGKGKKGKSSNRTPAAPSAPAKSASPAPAQTPTPASGADADLAAELDERARPKGGKKQAAASHTAESLWVCNVCATVFPTRNKMFTHIKETGHALADGYAASASASASASKKSKSKRK
ncbi:hypothetical protein BC831DRAFT_484128 [Entophlyctis helioformis]|nr:hypothetical protein BC831DRAFT_484128 [Entophlyctis helioformis]